MVIKVLILVHYKQGVKTIIEIDLSDYINSEVFFQLSNNRLLYFIIFFSKNFNPIKYNYKIYNKGLLAIIKYFE